MSRLAVENQRAKDPRRAAAAVNYWLMQKVGAGGDKAYLQESEGVDTGSDSGQIQTAIALFSAARVDKKNLKQSWNSELG